MKIIFFRRKSSKTKVQTHVECSVYRAEIDWILIDGWFTAVPDEPVVIKILR